MIEEVSWEVEMAGHGYCPWCKFYDRIPEGFPRVTLGKCRRHAPAPITRHTDLGSRSNGYWPVVGTYDWCGEFAAKPPEQK